MLFSLKDVSSKLSPSPAAEGLHTVKTNSFTLHHFESLTGMMFVLNTDPEIPGIVPQGFNFSMHPVETLIVISDYCIFHSLFQLNRHVSVSAPYILAYIRGFRRKKSIV